MLKAEILERVRSILDRYVGEPIRPHTGVSIQTEVGNLIASLQRSGDILTDEFLCTAGQLREAIGRLDIDSPPDDAGIYVTGYEVDARPCGYQSFNVDVLPVGEFRWGGRRVLVSRKDMRPAVALFGGDR